MFAWNLKDILLLRTFRLFIKTEMAIDLWQDNWYLAKEGTVNFEQHVSDVSEGK